MKLASEIRDHFPHLCVRENEPLAGYTTFRLGGPCPLLMDGAGADDLPGLIRLLTGRGMPFLVIGEGSNLVISDAGLECAVIRFCSAVPRIQADGRRITVSGDTRLDALAEFAIGTAAADLSFCSGIPGTVGGGLAGNAGAFGRQIGDHLISAVILRTDGAVETRRRDELGFAYRHSGLKETGGVVLSAVFEPPPGEAEALRNERNRILEFRRERHPDWHTTPCAGSVFRNIEPTSAAERRQAAGWFLEQAGAFGMRTGGARLFEKHANIIVADPGCTAQDVWMLSETLVQSVKAKFGIELQREVRFIGPFTPEPDAVC